MFEQLKVFLLGEWNEHGWHMVAALAIGLGFGIWI